MVLEIQRYRKQQISDIGLQLMQNPLDFRREQKVLLTQPILHRALSHFSSALVSSPFTRSDTGLLKWKAQSFVAGICRSC